MVNSVIAIGAVVVLIGAIGMMLPPLFRAFVNLFRSQVMLIFATAIRFAIGIVLILAAPACRFSDGVRVIGIVAIVAGIVLPLLGNERLQRVFDWVGAQSNTMFRFWAFVTILIGAFLLVAAL